MWRQLLFLLSISNSDGIIRRYFVVNGFDGALTMLGLMTGFIVSPPTELSIVIGVCLSAAIALGVSGVSSAYVSESAERKRTLKQLEDAMVSSLDETAHSDAARWVPLLTAIVNGMAPFTMSLLILSPLWLSQYGIEFILAPLHASVVIALAIVFGLGVFLGRISDMSLLVSGLRTMLLAILTTVLIYFFAGA
jgi:predicted membrane protein (TIGR00267 family)